MSSLRQILADLGPALLLDAASTRIQVGWLSATGHRWETSDEEAGIGVFRCVEMLGIDPTSAAAFLYCHGPGSILGIRTVAMALRTWTVLQPKPVFSYTSLALVAHAEGQPNLTVIADARRGLWHAYRLGGALQRVAPETLSGDLAVPAFFRAWSPLPAGTREVPYALPDLLSRIEDAEVFEPDHSPDAFLHEDPNYVTWTPQIHRAPTAS